MMKQIQGHQQQFTQQEEMKKATLDTKGIINLRNSKMVQSQNVGNNSKQNVKTNNFLPYGVGGRHSISKNSKDRRKDISRIYRYTEAPQIMKPVNHQVTMKPEPNAVQQPIAKIQIEENWPA